MTHSPFAAVLGMRMVWHDLLFAHWPVAPERLRSLVPPDLELDTFEGSAWLGVVPFRMSRVGPWVLAPLPALSAFAEINVRTYVLHRGRPGVWFFSLDAASPLAVRGARRFVHLPYFDARMACATVEGWIRYRSARTHRGAPAAEFRARYRPVGELYRATRAGLDAWLTERYCLYSADRQGTLYRIDIEHAPWPLQPAKAEIAVNTMAAPLGLALCDAPALLHFARRLDVRSGPLLSAD